MIVKFFIDEAMSGHDVFNLGWFFSYLKLRGFLLFFFFSLTLPQSKRREYSFAILTVHFALLDRSNIVCQEKVYWKKPNFTKELYRANKN